MARFTKKNDWAQNVCFDFLCTFVWNVSDSKKNSVGYHKFT